ncbi:hypothetical protein [Sediminicola luteus]|uniref:DUF378 domain-containing protein n=1 Tax=Sediminicola luteus TaxID=319238 RepID=A0A2A4GC70_9FLAO|nr:hypothetical protein [Sediminicola luteus]PCE66053.1 hypothetical protein B7P33_01765 [Sediminicola luteus]
MEDLKMKLGKAGAVLAVLGLLSLVLSIFNYNIRLLSWIDVWGSTMGWILRFVFIGVGGALFYLYGREEAE